jgi:hypothetical protein
MHALGTVPERAGAGQPRYRSEPDPCTSAASGAPIGTTSPGGTRSLVLPGQATCPKWHGPECQVECTPKPGKQEGPAPAPLEGSPCGPLSLLAQRSDAWPGGLPCPWNRGTMDAVACRKSTRSKRQSQRTRPCSKPTEQARLRNRLGWRALAAGVGHASTLRLERFHPGRGRKTRLIAFSEEQAGCEMGMSDRPAIPDRLARSSGYLADIQRCSVGRAGAKKSISSWLTRSASS